MRAGVEMRSSKPARLSTRTSDEEAFEVDAEDKKEASTGMKRNAGLAVIVVVVDWMGDGCARYDGEPNVSGWMSGSHRSETMKQPAGRVRVQGRTEEGAVKFLPRRAEREGQLTDRHCSRSKFAARSCTILYHHLLSRIFHVRGPGKLCTNNFRARSHVPSSD